VKILELSKEEISNELEKFYASFEDGYEFEQFLKVFLEALGLDEIEVTQSSSDGGIDLKATKQGIDELTDLDSIKYYVQAKRYKPNTNVAIESVRALRGILPDGYKGIFITTGKFSENSKKFALESESRPLILIDGEELINHCIKYGLGFRAKPIFVLNDIKRLINKEIKSEPNIITSTDTKNYIKKEISDNDIKARILPIPKSIFDEIKNHEQYFIKFKDKEPKIYKINRNRKYFGGITQIYRDFKLLDDNGDRHPTSSFWFLDKDNNTIEIEFEKHT
jgi:restriction system protein